MRHPAPARGSGRARGSLLIFVTGANGLIGRALVRALLARGHALRAGVHRAPVTREPAERLACVPVDFVADVEPQVWQPRLAGVDAVINTVGILRERGRATFARLHVEAPRALFTACAALAIRRVVQVSALGADRDAASGYHRSKRAADDLLLERVPGAWVAQPSLVFGAQGASARLFTGLAALPLVPIPDGAQRVQPIHLDDVVAALVALVEMPRSDGGRVALVGPAPVTLRDYLAALRAGMDLAPAGFLKIPRSMVRIAAAAGDLVPGLLLDRATLRMLERGNTASPQPTTRLLGRPPRAPSAFIGAHEAAAVRLRARLWWLLPLLRTSVGLVWIVTGIVSLGLYPVADSYALLARMGVTGALAGLLLYGAALLDLALGTLVFLLRGRARRWLWRAQLALILLYSALIAWRLPEFWLHPYGPMVKNVPLAALLVALDVLEDER